MIRNRIGIYIAALVTALAFQANNAIWAQSQAKTETPPSPSRKPSPLFQNLRFEEIWPQSGNSGRLKHIVLGRDEDLVLSLGGQLRLRGESWSNFSFGSSKSQDDEFGLFRLRLHADLQFKSRFRVFVEGKSALAAGRELPGGFRILDVDSADLQNALVDLKILPEADRLTLRVGRQELQFGKQRLVSPLDWSNTRPRSFDGARAIVRAGVWRLDAFWTQHVQVRKYALNSSNSGTRFFGAYAAGKLPGLPFDLDLYWLGLTRERSFFGGVGGREERHTFGARMGGSLRPGLDFDFEAARQLGEHGTRDVRAYSITGQLGHRFVNVRTTPRLYIGFDRASGDEDPFDGKVGTFNQLFPLGHAYFGFIDTVARQNAIDWNHGLSFNPVAQVVLSTDFHQFWRASRQDALYDAGGAVVRPGNAGTAKRLGWEIDFTAEYKVNRHSLVTGGLSYFLPGRFIRESGSSERIRFSYLTLQYTF